MYIWINVDTDNSAKTICENSSPAAGLEALRLFREQSLENRQMPIRIVDDEGNLLVNEDRLR